MLVESWESIWSNHGFLKDCEIKAYCVTDTLFYITSTLGIHEVSIL